MFETGGCALSYKYRGRLNTVSSYPRATSGTAARAIPEARARRLSSLPLTITLTFRRTILSFDPNENDSCPVF